MTKYEAEHEKKYPAMIGHITAKNYIGEIINTSWSYTVYWKDDTWVEQAKRHCESRIRGNKAELIRLQKAKEILDSIV